LLARLFDTASKFALFLVSSLKDKKLTEKQTHTKTETYKLYSRVSWIFLPNFTEVDPYNFQLYSFKDGVFFETLFRSSAIAVIANRTARMPARNMLLELLALYANRERHNAQCYRQTDRQMTGLCQ